MGWLFWIVLVGMVLFVAAGVLVLWWLMNAEDAPEDDDLSDWGGWLP